MIESSNSPPTETTGGDAILRVSTFELFFDLVFVVTVTQLTATIARHPTSRSLVQVVLMLIVIWWMYDGFSWLANASPARSTPRQLLMLASMAGFLVIALTIPNAFGDKGIAFAVAYLFVVCMHAGLYAGSSPFPQLRSVLGFARFNLITAALLLGAGLVHGHGARYALWTLAVLVIYLTPRLARAPSEHPIAAAHFVERHGGVVIIALGESVAAVAVAASRQSVTPELVAVSVLGLALSACLWWVYFGRGAELAERALKHAPVARRPWMALNGYYYCHLLLLLGIVGVAAVLQRAIGHATEPLDLARAVSLAGGTAVFLIGDILFCRNLGIPYSPWRLVATGLTLCTIPLGTNGSVLLEIGGIVLVIAATLLAEEATRSTKQRQAPHGSTRSSLE
jgi:low temperature requirement protein LtrA